MVDWGIDRSNSMAPSGFDNLGEILIPTYRIVNLPNARLICILREQFRKLLSSGFRIERQNKNENAIEQYQKLIAGLEATISMAPYRFDPDCTSKATELELAYQHGDWERVWKISDTLLGDLEYRHAIPRLKGLDTLETMEASVQVVKTWLLYVFNLAEVKIRPMDDEEIELVEEIQAMLKSRQARPTGGREPS
jgi:hypothetical protein